MLNTVLKMLPKFSHGTFKAIRKKEDSGHRCWVCSAKQVAILDYIHKRKWWWALTKSKKAIQQEWDKIPFVKNYEIIDYEDDTYAYICPKCGHVLDEGVYL